VVTSEAVIVERSMKIIVMSDSHGNTQALLDAVFDENPQLILHLGDCEKDCDKVRRVYPDINLRAVRGNGDFRAREPEYDEFVAESKRIFMTHGHMYGVKSSLDSVLNTAFSRSADILLFGHTHIPYYEVIDEMHVVNPGSIAFGAQTYAVLEIEHGVIRCRITRLQK
jgi:putative phosphoesterase